MQMVGALDLHRTQITFKWQDMETGEVKRGRIMPATREPMRQWLGQFRGRDAHFALEATTGWRFVVEEMQAAGIVPHLADQPRPVPGADRSAELRPMAKTATT